MSDLVSYKAKSGEPIPVWRLEINTRPDDAERLLCRLDNASAIQRSPPLALRQDGPENKPLLEFTIKVSMLSRLPICQPGVIAAN